MQTTIDKTAEIARLTKEIDALKDRRTGISGRIKQLDTLRSNLASAIREAPGESINTDAGEEGGDDESCF